MDEVDILTLLVINPSRGDLFVDQCHPFWRKRLDHRVWQPKLVNSDKSPWQAFRFLVVADVAFPFGKNQTDYTRLPIRVEKSAEFRMTMLDKYSCCDETCGLRSRKAPDFLTVEFGKAAGTLLGAEYHYSVSSRARK